MLLKKRTFSFFQASHFIIHSKNFVTISPRHVCSLQYICQQHNILTMKQQHDIKCKENLDKIRVADGIWTHDPPWSSLLDHGGSWVQIPSAARIFSEFSLHLITQHLKKVSWILLLKLSCVTRLMEKDFPRQSQLQKLYHKLNNDNPSIITMAKKSVTSLSHRRCTHVDRRSDTVHYDTGSISATNAKALFMQLTLPA